MTPRTRFAFCWLAAASVAAGLPAVAGQHAADFRDDRLIVKLSLESVARFESLPTASLPEGIAELEAIRGAAGLSRGHALARAAPGARRDPVAFRRIGLDRIYVLELAVPDRTQVRRLVADLARAPWVEYAEPVYRYALATTVPNDPLFPLQWAHENTGQSGGTPGADMNSTTGWSAGTGSPAGLIGVLDTGVDQDHPDLVANLVDGFDFTDSPEGLEDLLHHGTQVAGNAAARGNNGVGVAGVCWRCSILNLKVFGSTGFLTLEEIVPAVIFGADSGADVLNMSFGELAWSQAFADAVDYATALGTLSVAASGNAGLYQPLVPAALPGVVSVVGTTHDDVRLGSYGDHAEIAAPTDVTTTWPGGQYFVFRGTSAAAPFAAGLAGLLRATDPTLHVEELRQLLRLGAVDEVGDPLEDTLGWDAFLGYGRIDVGRSLAMARGPWLAFDRPHYVCGETLHVDHKDTHAGAAVEVVLIGDIGGDVETVNLSPVTTRGYYRGSIALSHAGSGPPVQGDGRFDASDGETVTAESGTLTARASFDCAKRVCLAALPEPPAAGDCDQDGALDPGEVWPLVAVFDNDQTEVLEGVEARLLSSASEVTTGDAVNLGQVNPIDAAVAGPFALALPAGAPESRIATFEFEVSGTGFEVDAAECTAGGFPTNFAIALNRDGASPDTWTALPPSGPTAGTAACPGAIEVAWGPVTGAGAYAIYRSEASCADARAATLPYATVSSTSFLDGAAASGVTYHYAIEALEQGTSCTTLRACASAACPCEPPTDPTRLRVVRSGPHLQLSWDDPRTPGLLWSIYRAPGPDPGSFGPALVAGFDDAEPQNPGIQFTDAAAASTPDSFFYLITAVNACAESPLFP